MGTARDPVVGSGTWPACTARVGAAASFLTLIYSFRIREIKSVALRETDFASATGKYARTR